jgi:hypothetical protein
MKAGLTFSVALAWLAATGVDDEWTRGRQPAAPYDVVIRNGRVMDPETGLDGVRNLGITAAPRCSRRLSH